jgi:TRAP-type C4-dicarboxylate transport system permease small subunit
MDRRRYSYWIHPMILKYAWKWKSKTCFNTPMVDRISLQTIIYDAILTAVTRRGFLYLALPITPCELTFPSLETSCKPLRRRESVKEFSPNGEEFEDLEIVSTELRTITDKKIIFCCWYIVLLMLTWDGWINLRPFWIPSVTSTKTL